MSTPIPDEIENKALNHEIIQRMILNGSDPTKIYRIDFYFSGEQDKLDKLGKDLEQRGFSYSDIKDEANNLTMIKAMKLDLDEISEIDYDFEIESRQLGIEYEGWGSFN